MKTSTITNITNIKKIYAKTVERNKKKVQIKKRKDWIRFAKFSNILMCLFNMTFRNQYLPNLNKVSFYIQIVW